MTPAAKTRALKQKFLDEFLKYGTNLHTAKAIGIHTHTVSRWLAEDPNFRHAHTQAQKDLGETLERRAIRRAMESSDSLMTLMLRRFFPERYIERVHQEIDIRAIEVVVSSFVNVVRKNVPDFCPNCKTHLGLTAQLATELKSLSDRLGKPDEETSADHRPALPDAS